ncbi:MAG: DUF3656 domain-containing protein [Candidatus Latescibacterota bacterium]
MTKLPELLAPAGSLETFKAGFDAGADAFYLGYRLFNARQRAKNFTEDELHLAADYAHQYGKKLYITLNTLVFDREIKDLIRLIEILGDIKADGVIVQDWGVISILREEYPDLPIHASTQMFCHNSLHAEFLRSQGVSRIILPRELTLDEIGTMMQRVPFQYEVFIHGAMCFSFSGCCLASSYLYGESGNRGGCCQVCRFPFREGEETVYPFSMKDLQATEVVGKLVDMGISALKIEGRLKNTEYVAETVSAYRKILDSYSAETFIPSMRQEISKQRESSSGYFVGGAEYDRLVQKFSKGTIGEVLGEVLHINGKEISIACTLKPQKGFRLRVQDARGKNIHEGTLLDFSHEKDRKGKEILTWKIFETLKPEGYTAPFTVYFIGRSAPQNVRLLLEKDLKNSYSATISLRVNVTQDTIHIDAAIRGVDTQWDKEYSLTTQPSVANPLNDRECAKIFAQVDTYPFQIETITCKIEENLFCPVSELKRVRRTFYQEFHSYWIENEELEKRNRFARIMKEKLLATKKHMGRKEKRYFTYSALPGQTVSKEPEYTVYRLEVGEIPNVRPSPTVMILPPLFLSEALVVSAGEWIDTLVSKGYTCFMLPTYGWLPLMERYRSLDLAAGTFFYMVNPFAVEYFEKCGIRQFVLSPDIRPDDASPLDMFDNRLFPRSLPKEMFVTRLRVNEGEYFHKNTAFKPKYHREYTVIEECK